MAVCYDQMATAGDHMEKVTLYKYQSCLCSSFVTFSLKSSMPILVYGAGNEQPRPRLHLSIHRLQA